jgi:hypothetical protein
MGFVCPAAVCPLLVLANTPASKKRANLTFICGHLVSPGVPNVRVMSERLTEAEAQSRGREILMAHPAALVRIEKTDEPRRAK